MTTGTGDPNLVRPDPHQVHLTPVLACRLFPRITFRVSSELTKVSHTIWTTVLETTHFPTITTIVEEINQSLFRSLTNQFPHSHQSQAPMHMTRHGRRPQYVATVINESQ
ncbi:hypothetical protein J6590_015742 [Homalodisca vitripennis]|nr:hypothetical protein J6590_015742 [Homalodisca vitripennis]